MPANVEHAIRAAPEEGLSASTSASDPRLQAIFAAQVQFVGRTLRRFGVPAADVEDAAQKVFLVLARRLASVAPGAERAFLVSTALRVASDVRRSSALRRQPPEDASELADEGAPPADQLLDQKRAREILDRVLDAMPDKLRAVFVLFELEGLTTDEIAEALSLPRGTVASRMRRARDEFEAQVKRLGATRERKGGRIS
jgi:RNA polymerase sigma-70 factor (ECF subfamily)